jgi:hypothetical protein
MALALKIVDDSYQQKKLSVNVLQAIDAVKASGATVDENTIILMSSVDRGVITDDEAILKIIAEESLIAG